MNIAGVHSISSGEHSQVERAGDSSVKYKMNVHIALVVYAFATAVLAGLAMSSQLTGLGLMISLGLAGACLLVNVAIQKRNGASWEDLGKLALAGTVAGLAISLSWLIPVKGAALGVTLISAYVCFSGARAYQSTHYSNYALDDKKADQIRREALKCYFIGYSTFNKYQQDLGGFFDHKANKYQIAKKYNCTWSAVNCPKPPQNLSKIERETNEIYQRIVGKSGGIKYNYTELKKGVCWGVVMDFFKQILEGNSSVEELEKRYSDGPSLAIQTYQLHQNSFFKNSSTAPIDDVMHPLGMHADFVIKGEGLKSDLSSLSDGCYYLSAKFTDGGHAMAYLVRGEKRYFLDPNYGLFDVSKDSGFIDFIVENNMLRSPEYKIFKMSILEKKTD